MSTTTVGLFLRHLALSEEVSRLNTASDRDLLTTYEGESGQAAFTELMRRHGPMVLRTCRRVLSQDADAEDAFQATFLLLARKAGRLRREVAGPLSLGGWLHHVAYQTAVNVLSQSTRRRVHERRAVAMSQSDPDPIAKATWNEVRPILDAELDALPDEPRRLLIACYLQGKTYTEAAAELGLPRGSMAWRLEQARALLAERLIRRGVTLSIPLLAVLLQESARGAGVPAVLLVHTVEAARTFTEQMTGMVSENVVRLVKGGLAQMTRSSMRLSMALVGWVGLLGAGLIACQTLRAWPDQMPPTGETPVPPAAKRPRQEDQKQTRTDHFGDPLPEGALARIGTVRLRPGRFPGNAAVALTRDNKTIYSVDGHDEVHVWDLATGKEMRTLPGPGTCLGLALSPDSRRLVVGGEREVWAWDLGPGIPQLRWKQKPKDSRGHWCVAFAPDGRTLACGGESTQAIYLLDAATGELQRTLPGRGYKLVFSPDGRSLASWARDNAVCVWDVATGKQRHSLVCGAKNERVSSFAFAADGKRLVAAAANGSIRLWDLATGQGRRLTDTASSNAFVAFEPEGKVLVEAGGGHIRFRDPATGKECRPAVPAPQLTANTQWDACRLSVDGKLFVSAAPNAIGVWEVGTGRPVGPAGVPMGDIVSLVFSPDGQGLALAARSGGWDGCTAPQLYDTRTGRLRGEFRHPTSGNNPLVFTSQVGFAPGQQLLVTGVELVRRGSLTGFSTVGKVGEDATAKTILSAAAKDLGALHALAHSPDGRLIAAGRRKGGIALYDRAAGKLLRTLEGQSAVTALAFAADGNSVAGWEYNVKTITVWDVSTGRRAGGWEVKLPPGEVIGDNPPLALSPDGRRVALGCDAYGPVRVWDVSSGALLWQVADDANLARALAFSPDGRMLATGGRDGVVRLREVHTGQERLRRAGHRAKVDAVAFAPDGLRLATGSADTTALVWDIGSHRPTKGEAGPDALWAALTGSDAAAAYRAILALADAPATAVPLLQDRFTPPPPAPDQVKRWITELDDEQFTIREAATRALAARGNETEPALRKALADNPSPEARRRLAQLIARFGPQSSSGLGVVRGVEALERMAAEPAARKLLNHLAEAPAESFLGQEARAALRRLDRAERR